MTIRLRAALYAAFFYFRGGGRGVGSVATIGRTRLLHMRWGGNKSRQGERETRLDADAKAHAILIALHP